MNKITQSILNMQTFLNAGKRFYSSRGIKKSVFISQSKDIYTNIALEEWLHKNFDFSNHHVLLLCQNDPSVVIGKEQNPWIETNLKELSTLTKNGVNVVRKNADTETFYEDNGSLNMTFFTPKEYLNQKSNFEVISRAIFREYNIKVNVEQINDQSDKSCLTVRNKKISTTGIKLGRLNAHHNCALFVNINKDHFNEALNSQEYGIKNVKKTEKTKIMNLWEEHKKINIKSLQKAIGWEFMRISAENMLDGGIKLANQQMGFQMINPTENWFPGITEIRDKLVSWQWLFGATPTFSVTRSFNLNKLNSGNGDDIKITMKVENGIITDVSCWIPPLSSIQLESDQVDTIFHLKNQKFSVEVINVLEETFGNFDYEKDGEKFMADYKQAMISI